MAEQQVERFRPTSGRVTGVLGLVLACLVAAAFVGSAPPSVAVPGVLACAFAAVLVWLALLRPGAWATETDLHLRSLGQSFSIPLASIDTVVVRRYLLVRSGGERYICPAIGRSLRKTIRTELRWRPPQLLSPVASLDRLGEQGSTRGPSPGAVQEIAYADFVEQRIQQLADKDRLRRGIEARSEEEYELGSQAVTRMAWAELAALAVLAVAFAVAVVVL